MSRWASGLNATAAGLPAVMMVTLVDLNFSDGTIRLHDGAGVLTFGGNAYTGVGDYGSIDQVGESTEGIAKTVELVLSGVPGPLLTEAVTQNYQGRIATIYVGLFAFATMKFIDTPEVVWQGRMDYMTVEINEGSTAIKLRCEHRLNREPLVARYTDVDQQLAHPGDSFFDLVWLIPLSQCGWGGATVQYPLNVPPDRNPVGPAGHHPGGRRR